MVYVAGLGEVLVEFKAQREGSPSSEYRTARLIASTTAIAGNLVSQCCTEETHAVNRLTGASRFVGQRDRGCTHIRFGDAGMFATIRTAVTRKYSPMWTLVRVTPRDTDTTSDGLGLLAPLSVRVLASIAATDHGLLKPPSRKPRGGSVPGVQGRGSRPEVTDMPAPSSAAAAAAPVESPSVPSKPGAAATERVPTVSQPKPEPGASDASVDGHRVRAFEAACDAPSKERFLGASGVALRDSLAVFGRTTLSPSSTGGNCEVVPIVSPAPGAGECKAEKQFFSFLAQLLVRMFLSGLRTGFVLDPIVFRHLTSTHGSGLSLLDQLSCGRRVAGLIDSVRACNLGSGSKSLLLDDSPATSEPPQFVTEANKRKFVVQTVRHICSCPPSQR